VHSLIARTKNDGVEVEVERKFDVTNNTTSANVKVNTILSKLDHLKVESSLESNSTAYVKLN